MEDETAIWPLWAPHASDDTGREGITILARVVNPDYQRKLGYTMEARESVSPIGDLFGCLLALLGPN